MFSNTTDSLKEAVGQVAETVHGTAKSMKQAVSGTADAAASNIQQVKSYDMG